MVTRKAFIENNRLIFQFPFNVEVKERVKKCHSRCRFDGEKRIWHIPVGAISHNDIPKIEAVINEYGFDGDALEYIRGKAEEREKLLDLSKKTDYDLDLTDIDLGFTPRGYQNVGVKYLMDAGTAILGDGMRLGKSVTAGVAIKKLRAFPTLVVTTASTKIHWEREFREKIKIPTTFVISGRSETEIPKLTNVVIINYAILADHVDMLQLYGFKSIIVDEAHNFGSKTSARTKALKKLTKRIPVRFGLTGTLFRNNIKELATVLDCLRLFEKLGYSEWDFLHNYTEAEHNGYGWKFSGGKNLEELYERLRSHGVYIRRTKYDVIAELPPIQQTTLTVPISNRAEYNRLEKKLQGIMRAIGDAKDQMDWVSEHLEGQQLGWAKVNLSAHNRENKDDMLKTLTQIRELVGMGKVEEAIRWIDDFLRETDEKLVVFAHHKSVQNAILEHYGDLCCSILAEHSPEKRELNRHEFQTNPNKRIIVCSLKAGSEGIDLSAASTVLHIEYWWNAAIMDQANARIEAVGKTSPLYIYYLSGESTIDQYSEQLIDYKRRLGDSVSDGKNSEIPLDIYAFFRV